MGRPNAEPDHRFGASPPPTIGVEEELLLVDEERRLVATAEQVINGLDPATRDVVSTEIFAAQIELKTRICADAAAAAIELSDLRTAVRATGAGLLGAGIHPDDGGEARLIRKPRYDVVREDLASLLSTPPSGLHVHVGMRLTPRPRSGSQMRCGCGCRPSPRSRRTRLSATAPTAAWRAPAPPRSAPTRASKCRVSSAATRSSSPSPTS